MSHVTTIDLEIKDLPSLAAACKRIGLELVEGQETYRWYGTSVGDYPLPEGFTVEDLGHCEHAIRLPGKAKAYEIGVVKRRDGKQGYTLLWDFWNGGRGMEAVAGEDGCHIKQAYATEVATKEARRQGFRVTEQKLDNGTVQLQCFKA